MVEQNFALEATIHRFGTLIDRGRPYQLLRALLCDHYLHLVALVAPVAARGWFDFGDSVLLVVGLSGWGWARSELHMLHLKVFLTNRRLVKGINSSRFNGCRFRILNRR